MRKISWEKQIKKGSEAEFKKEKFSVNQSNKLQKEFSIQKQEGEIERQQQRVRKRNKELPSGSSIKRVWERESPEAMEEDVAEIKPGHFEKSIFYVEVKLGSHAHLCRQIESFASASFLNSQATSFSGSEEASRSYTTTKL